MLNFLIQTILICGSIVLSFVWSSQENLYPYTLQFLGLVILLYFVFRMLFSNKGNLIAMLDATIFSSVSLLLVVNSGRLDSPLFFILYFLLFALSLLFSAKQSLLISLTLIVLFVTDPHFTGTNSQIINLITLLLITPLAISFGARFLDSLESAGKIAKLDNLIAKEETDVLMWISTKANPLLTQIIDNSSQLIGNNTLPFRVNEKIKNIHADLIKLHQSAKDLEDDIDSSSK